MTSTWSSEAQMGGMPTQLDIGLKHPFPETPKLRNFHRNPPVLNRQCFRFLGPGRQGRYWKLLKGLKLPP